MNTSSPSPEFRHQLRRQPPSPVTNSDLLKGSEKIEKSGKKRKRSLESSTSSKPVEMSTTNRQWSIGELNLGKRVLKEYSTNGFHYNHGGDYWNLQIWLEILAQYNSLARQQSLPVLNGTEFLDLGKRLQSEYCLARKRAKSYGHTDMEDVFSLCPNCQKRIPVFPKHLPSGSNSLSNTTSEAFGNDSNNGGGQELNSAGGRSKIVEQKVKEMWLADHLLDQHVAELFSAPELCEGVWYEFLLDDTIPITRKSQLLIVKFCGGASTSRQ
ncbi:uncharacterized protein LOC104903706 isoform X1 [Beta vulgaris subsp. vulgaris]|uniref:uncharacterized protein LOC104903706 isoform X1 n=1 Tax=Beta vulgaris subsp. vulgaris TaxID=3555 RepID=UPI00203726D5|nr:uncharacterized protein LOC104903706 isoform X1 [Beta vulgaris subsp. vulgaris]